MRGRFAHQVMTLSGKSPHRDDSTEQRQASQIINNAGRVESSSRCMSVAELTVVVPDRPVVARVALEEELRDAEDAARVFPTERALGRLARLAGRPLNIESFLAGVAFVLVTSHVFLATRDS